MKVEVLSDVMVPLGVTAVNIGARAFDVRKGKTGIMAYQPLAGMLGVAAGYAMQAMGKTEKTAKIGNRIAVASFPAAGVAIYDWILSATSKTTTTTTAARTVGVSADPLLQYRKGSI